MNFIDTDRLPWYASKVTPPDSDHPLTRLPAEDLDLILRFVLASGSLKDLAQEYGVSYPTIRARLDRLIARVQQLACGREPDPFLDELADRVEAGELTVSAAKRLRQVYLDQVARLRRGPGDE